MDNNFQEKLIELKKGYLKKLKGILCDFDVLLTSEKIDVNEVYSKVHTVSGTSGMYGLLGISEFSNEFEAYLKEIKENQNFNQEELRGKFSVYIQNIKNEVTEA